MKNQLLRRKKIARKKANHKILEIEKNRTTKGTSVDRKERRTTRRLK